MKLTAVDAFDFYKSGHIYQYPEKTEVVFSNFTARSDKHFVKTAVIKKFKPNGVVLANLQGFIKWFMIDLWNDTFFNKKKEDVLQEFKELMDGTLGENKVTTEHIAELHGLGYLPLAILALPEGSVVPIKVPMLAVINTHPKFSWLTNHIETVMSSELWQPITNATIAKLYHNIFKHYAKETCDNDHHVPYQAHDFSFRGLPGYAASSSSGLAHLFSFIGTDNVAGVKYARNYYGGEYSSLGSAVPATEHSVMCLGTQEDEFETYRRLIEDTYPTGIVSIVSDTWNLWKVICDYALRLKDSILQRDGKTVFRPDSGFPPDILCGLPSVAHVFAGNFDPDEHMNFNIVDTAWKVLDKTFTKKQPEFVLKIVDDKKSTLFIVNAFGFKMVESLTPEQLGVVECLYNIFGGRINDKGYKELDEHVGVLYGESITPDIAVEIFERLKAKGFASNSVLMGIGSYAYQYNTRDTFGMAMKATAGIVDGKVRELFKDPITDDGVKKSAKGFLRVIKNEKGEYILEDGIPYAKIYSGEMDVVFCDGKLVKEESIYSIRERLAKY